MSPNMQNQQTDSQNDTHSPWTDAFQTNPVHREGNYDNDCPEHSEAQSPTWYALSAMYDPSERE